MRIWISVFAAALLSAVATWAQPQSEVLSFDKLTGWAEDDHDAALRVFAETCDLMNTAYWGPVCGLAKAQSGGGKAFFEALFRPVLVGGDQTALFTGYYEPELNGSRRRGGPYRWALHRAPRGFSDGRVWATRAQIEDGGLLRGREIVWVDDPVEKYFLQVQGSGRIVLNDGTKMRVGYGGQNGHPFRSVGQELVRRGIYNKHQVSQPVIKRWVRNNPAAGRRLLQANPSYVFFREVSKVPADKGPLGAMNRSITGLRSIAIDRRFVTLGTPVWIEKDGRDPMRRLMIGQDTGGAIRGAQRADIFFGTGDEAGRQAGRVRDPGRMVLLLPIPQAFALVPQG